MECLEIAMVSGLEQRGIGRAAESARKATTDARTGTLLRTRTEAERIFRAAA